MNLLLKYKGIVYEEEEGYVRADCLHLLNSQITPRTMMEETRVSALERSETFSQITAAKTAFLSMMSTSTMATPA